MNSRRSVAEQVIKRMQQRYGYDSKSYFAIQWAVRDFFNTLSSGVYAKITAEDILECEKKVRALDLVKNRIPD